MVGAVQYSVRKDVVTGRVQLGRPLRLPAGHAESAPSINYETRGVQQVRRWKSRFWVARGSEHSLPCLVVGWCAS